MSDTDVVLFDMSDDEGQGHVVSEEGESAASPAAVMTTTTTTTTTTVVTTTTTTAVVASPTADKSEDAAEGSDEVTAIEPEADGAGDDDDKAEPGDDAAPKADEAGAEQAPAEQAPVATDGATALVVDDKYTKTWEPNSDWSSRWEKMTKIPPKTQAGRLRIESARKGLRDPTGLQPARITSGRSRITRSARGRPNAEAASSSLGRKGRAAAPEAIPEGEAPEGSSPQLMQGDGGSADGQRLLSPAVPYVERQSGDDQQGRPSDAILPMSIPEDPTDQQQDQAHDGASATATNDQPSVNQGAADNGDGSEQEPIAMLSSIPDEEPAEAAATAAADGNGNDGSVDAPVEPSSSAGDVKGGAGASLLGGAAVQAETSFDSSSAGGGAKPKRKVVWNEEQLGEA